MRLAFENFVLPSRFGAGGLAAFPFQASQAPKARVRGEFALVMNAHRACSAQQDQRGQAEEGHKSHDVSHESDEHRGRYGGVSAETAERQRHKDAR